MRPSSINLSDPESVRKDEGGRSVAYFCKASPSRVDRKLIAELKHLACKGEGANLRLCLHSSPDAIFHEMIIFEHRGKYYRPHKHVTKAESYHIIEGSMAAFVFDELGRVVDACRLETQKNLVYRVGGNMYHAVQPLSDLVIYHETKPGPFVGEGDCVYAPWAPDGNDAGNVASYTHALLECIGGW